jgi:hypothetical protein
LLVKNKEPPIIRDATLGRARVIKQGRRHIIALVTKTRASILTENYNFEGNITIIIRCYIGIKFTNHIHFQNKHRFNVLGLYKENFTGIV